MNKLLIPSAADPPVSEAHCSPGDRCLKRIATLFATARRSVDVCVFTITDDRIAHSILVSNDPRLVRAFGRAFEEIWAELA